ncbi:MAG: putative quinol monooxygenase [Burkholderiaceae bacterium]
MIRSIVATIKVKDGHQQDFEAAAGKLVKAVNEHEAGCLLYTLNKGDDPLTYVFMERYQDDEAVKAHRASDHFKTYGREMGAFMDGAPSVYRAPGRSRLNPVLTSVDRMQLAVPDRRLAADNFTRKLGGQVVREAFSAYLNAQRTIVAVGESEFELWPGRAGTAEGHPGPLGRRPDGRRCLSGHPGSIRC